jgi:hypothetical protein
MQISNDYIIKAYLQPRARSAWSLDACLKERCGFRRAKPRSHIRASRLFESAGRQRELGGGVATTARLMLNYTSNMALDRSTVCRFQMICTS